jgi:RND family efflux transporter MFP subunit
MDKAIADVKSAQARVEVATAALEQANEQLTYTQVRAPYAGLVTQRHVQVGEMASPGQPLMTGISLKQLRVAVDVPQNLIPAIRAGQGVRIHLPDNQVVAATGMTVFPFADQGSNTFKVRLNLPANLANLYPGMFVKAGFLTGEKRELAIPKSAVVQRSEVTGTYVIKEGKVSFRQIRVGRDLGDTLVVLSGLSEGEQVALDPISAGATLKAQAQGGGERKDG